MYTIKDVAQRLDVSPHTLRFWAKSGLFPFIRRDKNNIRIFSENDLEWIKIVKCLRSVGIDNKSIKKYIELYRAIKNIKARVLRGARVKRLSSFSDKALVYGAYILSPIRTKLFDKNSDKIISATNFVLRELDETYKKQVIILNYIKFLTKNN